MESIMLDAQLKRGLLDACILSVISKGETYGYKLIEDTKPIIEISESTLYPILKRMEQNGYLKTESREYNGRLRKYYSVTIAGKTRLLQYRREFNEVKRIFEYIFHDRAEMKQEKDTWQIENREWKTENGVLYIREKKENL